MNPKGGRVMLLNGLVFVDAMMSSTCLLELEINFSSSGFFMYYVREAPCNDELY